MLWQCFILNIFDTNNRNMSDVKSVCNSGFLRLPVTCELHLQRSWFVRTVLDPTVEPTINVKVGNLVRFAMLMFAVRSSSWRLRFEVNDNIFAFGWTYHVWNIYVSTTSSNSLWIHQVQSLYSSQPIFKIEIPGYRTWHRLKTKRRWNCTVLAPQWTIIANSSTTTTDTTMIDTTTNVIIIIRSITII